MKGEAVDNRESPLAVTLVCYIKTHYAGSQRQFAQALDVKPQQVTKWLNMGCIVVDHTLYSPRRDIGPPSINE